MRKGFTLMELMVVIVVIGILGTLGYRKIVDVVDSSKAESFINETKLITTAMAEAYKRSGGVYQSCGSAPVYGVDETTTHYGTIDDSGSCSDDPSSYGAEIENALAEALKEKGYVAKDVGGTPVMRLYKSVPSVKVWFLPEYGGVRIIRYQGVPGKIALKVARNVNGKSISGNEGYDGSKPVIVTKYDSGTGLVASGGGGGGGGGSDANASVYVDALVPADKRYDSEEAIVNKPKVDLYQVIQYPQSW